MPRLIRPHVICNATDYGAVDYLVRADGLVAMRGRKAGQAAKAPWLVLTRSTAAKVIRCAYRYPTIEAAHERWTRDADVSHPFWRAGFRASAQVDLSMVDFSLT